jgi:hypothetical protein
MRRAFLRMFGQTPQSLRRGTRVMEPSDTLDP